MRLLTSSALCLALSAFVLGAPFAAEARVKHRHHKAPAAAKPAAKTSDTTTDDASAPADDAPVATVNADGTIRPPVIDDAPADDYQRVAWCDGVLSGDMDLANYIKDVQPADPTLQLIGQSYLRAYEAALTLSGKGQNDAGHAKAEKARQRGYDGWKAALAADPRKAAWTYDNWQLPGDCEHAAVRLSGHPNLFAEMATDEEAKAISDTLASGGPHTYDDLPKPVLTAKTTPVDPNAPISTNTLAVRAKQAAVLPPVPGQAKAADAAPAASKN